MDEVRLIKGSCAIDDRGAVSFVNDFEFEGVKRFYTVTNHRVGFVRAWHGHKHEAKYCSVVHGTALICCIGIDDWENPSLALPIHRFVMSAESPAVLQIPAGYVNGAMTLTSNAKILYLSTSTLEHAGHDDFRFPARRWDPWHIEER